MKNHDYKLSIAIPASIVSDVPHLREKTMKIGLVGRAAAIFCVNEIIVFPDLPNTDQKRDTNLVATILSYMETPQYLRKRLFKIKPELHYAGILPPLRTPHHPISDRIKDLAVGEHREGAVLSLTEAGSLVDIGVERPVLIPNTELPLNTRVTVRITKLEKHPKATIASRNEIEEYWGYRITVSDLPFGRLVKNQPFDLVIATSRHGTPLMKVIDELAKRWEKSYKILVAFGAPAQGLYDIVARENLKLNEIAHFTVNTIPNQGTETVRTEEALYASLAVLKLIIGE
jgi:predicted SPOUT superfamily RNA methylase MTH1